MDDSQLFLSSFHLPNPDLWANSWTNDTIAWNVSMTSVVLFWVLWCVDICHWWLPAVLSFLVVQKDSNLSIIRSWNWQLSNVLIKVVFEQIIFSFLKKREKKIVPNHALRRNWNFLGNAENGNAKKYESNSEFISNLSSTTRERSVNQYSEKLDGKSLDILL